MSIPREREQRDGAAWARPLRPVVAEIPGERHTSPAEDDDRPLIQGIARREKSALAGLFRRHRGAVFAYAATMVPVTEDAEEILQDVFLTAWDRLGSATIVGSSALPWLLVTCRNKALVRSRSLTRKARRTADTVAEPRSVEPGPEESAVLAEFTAALDSAIAALPPLDQSLVEICLVDGRSYAEASRLLGVSHGTVRNRLSRLRAVLARELRTVTGKGGHA